MRPVVPLSDTTYVTSVTYLKKDETIDTVSLKADCFEESVRNDVLALNPDLSSIIKRHIFDDLNVIKGKNSKFAVLQTLLRPDVR